MKWFLLTLCYTHTLMHKQFVITDTSLVADGSRWRDHNQTLGTLQKRCVGWKNYRSQKHLDTRRKCSKESPKQGTSWHIWYPEQINETQMIVAKFDCEKNVLRNF